MDITLELKKIIDKYGINNCNKELCLYYEIEDKLKEMIDNIPEDKTIAIRGGGEPLWCYLSAIGTERSKRIKYCIDKKAIEFRVVEQESITIDRMKDHKIDVVIIISYNARDVIYEELMNTSFSGEVIDIYEHLKEKDNIVLGNWFYWAKSISYHSIYNSFMRYRLEKCESEKKRYLQIVISQFLLIKDIKSSLLYIDMYINNGYDEDDTYALFKKALKELCNSIQKQIKENKQPHIIVNWIDELMYEEVDDSMTFLKKVAERGIQFNNAYAAAVPTTLEMNSIHTGKRIIEDLLPIHPQIDNQNSSLIRTLDSYDYDYLYCGQAQWKRFRYDQKCFNYHRAELSNGNKSDMVPMTIYQWEGLNLLVNAKRPVLMIMHSLIETHWPYISGDLSIRPNYMQMAGYLLSIEDDPRAEQKKICKKYSDEQLEWYHQFTDSFHNIYMSDHGKLFNEMPFGEKKNKIVFLVEGPGIPNQEYEQFFSLIDFQKLVVDIIKKDDFSNCLKDYVKIESADCYGGVSSLEFITDYYRYKGNEQVIDCALAKKVIRCNNEEYILLANGKEFYFLLPDERKNLANDEQYRDRIIELRAMAGTDFIDIYKHDEYKNTRILYDVMVKDNRADFIKLI